MKLKKKLQTRVNVLKQLGNSSWNSNASTIRTAALSLVFSTGEFCAPVLSNSSNASKIDPILNEACRVITGCLRPTPLEDIYVLSGIAPPNIRRTDAETKLHKLTEERNPLLKYKPPKPRINRKTWLTHCVLSPEDPESVRLARWQERTQRAAMEKLPRGSDLPRKQWCTLNWLRTRVCRTRDNLTRWKITDDACCPCGTNPQTLDHVITDCPVYPTDKEDVWQDVPPAEVLERVSSVL